MNTQKESMLRRGAGVLVVADNENSRSAIARMLRRDGCRVVDAPDADSALATIRGNTFVQVAVIDLDARNENGHDTADAIRSLAPHSAIVLLTTADTIVDATTTGATILRRPCGAKELIDAVRLASQM